MKKAMRNRSLLLVNSVLVFSALIMLWEAVILIFHVQPYMLPDPLAVVTTTAGRFPDRKCRKARSERLRRSSASAAPCSRGPDIPGDQIDSPRLSQREYRRERERSENEATQFVGVGEKHGDHLRIIVLKGDLN